MMNPELRWMLCVAGQDFGTLFLQNAQYYVVVDNEKEN